MFTRVALGLLVAAVALGAGFFGRELITSLQEVRSIGPSAEAAEALRFLSSIKSRDTKIWCKPLVVEYNVADMMDEPKRRHVLFLKNLHDKGYIIEDKQPREFNWQNLTTGRKVFLPTDKLVELGLSKDGSCYIYRTGSVVDVKIVNEERHQKHKDVTIVGATYEYVGETEYERLLLAVSQGAFYQTASRKARLLVLLDPYQGNKARVVRSDYGDRVGPFLTNAVPDGLAKINMAGPEQLRSR